MPNVSWIMPQVDELDSNRLMELMKYLLQHSGNMEIVDKTIEVL